MSLITPEEKHTVYRFMFISLLNLGAGTVCIILGLSWTIATLASRVPQLKPWGSTLFPERRPLDIGVLLVGIILCYFFFERWKVFYTRALRVPFSMALPKFAARMESITPRATIESSGLVPKVPAFSVRC